VGAGSVYIDHARIKCRIAARAKTMFVACVIPAMIKKPQELWSTATYSYLRRTSTEGALSRPKEE
jgi:hypothetical protein